MLIQEICRKCLDFVGDYFEHFHNVLNQEDCLNPVGQGSGGDVSLKVDLESESFWIDTLNRLSQEYQVTIELFSEERGRIALGNFPEKIYAVMDPLYGSFNIKSKLSYYSIGIAFAAEPVVKHIKAAFILDIAHKDIYYSLGEGYVYKNHKKIERMTTPAPYNILLIEQLYREEGREMLAQIAPYFKRVRCLGSSLLNICNVVTGGADMYCYPYSSRVFDFAAAVFFLEQMGYTYKSLQGSCLSEACFDFVRYASYLAGYDKKIVDKMVKVLNG